MVCLISQHPLCQTQGRGVSVAHTELIGGRSWGLGHSSSVAYSLLQELLVPKETGKPSSHRSSHYLPPSIVAYFALGLMPLSSEDKNFFLASVGEDSLVY